ncbi:MAG: phosphoenolpyruvate carboxylase [Pirellulales bacterium]
MPPEALDGTLRLTEQGEVLAERYDDTQIAFRHLEQVAWATLTASALPGVTVKPAWREMLNEVSKRSYTAYRELVDQPGFIQFFASATPIDEIENLPIGSRPSRRRGERSLGDLRDSVGLFVDAKSLHDSGLVRSGDRADRSQIP